MEKLLENKTILIAGAGGLLGAHLVSSILKQGATIIAVDMIYDSMLKKLSELEIDLNSEFIKLFELDITDEKCVVDFFKDENLKLDGAVNATYPRNKSYGKDFYDVGMGSFNENLSLHLGSAFLFSQQCAKYFQQRCLPFSLVNISSVYGTVAPKFEIYSGTNMTMPVEYSAIKSAIVQLNKYICTYVSNSLFRVNSISPGGILDNQPDTFIEKYTSKTLGHGMLQPEDIVGAAMFLLSDQSKFINGQNIIIDDGFSL